MRRADVETGELVGEELSEEAIRQQAIPEGSLIGIDTTQGIRANEVVGYTRDSSGEVNIRLKNGDTGFTTNLAPDRFSKKSYKRYEPRPDTTVSLDGWNNTDSVAERKEIARSTVDDVLPKLEDLQEAYQDVSPKKISDGKFDELKDTIANEMAHARDRDHADRVISSLAAVGDNVARANARPDVSPIEEDRGFFRIGEGSAASTQAHELAHHTGYAYGFAGTSNDMDGNTDPMPVHSWESPNFEAEEKYGISTPPAERDGSVTDKQSIFINDEDWRDTVESEVGTGLDGRNFSSASDDLGASDGETLDSDTMIQLNSAPATGEPQNWKVESVDDVDALDSSELDDFTRTINAEQRLTLRGRDGEEEEVLLENRAGNPRVNWSRSSEYKSGMGIRGTRQSVPDDWGSEYPDAGDVLGTQEFDDNEAAFRNFIDKVNKSWYRMAAASRELGPNEAADLAMKGGYDAKNAHETLARVNEVMRTSDDQPLQKARAMQSLVRYHPDLLEAYRNVYEIPDQQATMLNRILDKEDVDFEVDTDAEIDSYAATSIDTILYSDS
jgi:hypothetical protein